MSIDSLFAGEFLFFEIRTSGQQVFILPLWWSLDLYLKPEVEFFFVFCATGDVAFLHFSVSVLTFKLSCEQKKMFINFLTYSCTLERQFGVMQLNRQVLTECINDSKVIRVFRRVYPNEGRGDSKKKKKKKKRDEKEGGKKMQE